MQSLPTASTQFEKKKGSFIGEFLTKKLIGEKRKPRPINAIRDIRKVPGNSLAIEIVFEEKNSTKGLVYECITQDNQSEIIAKINFLKVISHLHYSLEKHGEAPNPEKNDQPDSWLNGAAHDPREL